MRLIAENRRIAAACEKGDRLTNANGIPSTWSDTATRRTNGEPYLPTSFIDTVCRMDQQDGPHQLPACAAHLPWPQRNATV